MRSQVVKVLIFAFASQLVALSSPSLTIQCTFGVQLKKPLERTEKLAISGDTESLGKWSPNAVLFLNQTDSGTIYLGKVQCTTNTVVNYRYLVGVVGENGDLQIRKWETHVEGRSLEVGRVDITTSDEFGDVNGETKLHAGWLNSGYILEFKLFRNPIQLNVDAGHRTYVKVTALDSDNESSTISSSARADIRVVRMETGDSNFRAQGTYGVPYDRDDIVVFHITTNDLEKVFYKFTVSNTDDGGETTELGSQIVYPNFIQGSEGQIRLELMSTKNDSSVIGTLTLGYLLIKPMSSEYNYDFRTSFIQYWRNDWHKLDAGHRGLGYSLQVDTKPAPVTENTVASYLAAGQYGADIVEFDVQLTSDYVPVIFHDFTIPVAKDPSVEPTSADDIKSINIKDLTYDELKNTNIYDVVDSKVIKYKSPNEESRVNWRLFPTFEVVLEVVPLSIGMDIEIKWPQLQSDGQKESVQTIDKNFYVDTILDVMYQKGCGRLSFFTSQDLDILTMVNFKQNMYPIMPLGYLNDFYADPRLENYEQLMNNAIAFSFVGISPDSFIFDQAGIASINMANDQNLQVCIWGDEVSNSSTTFEYYQSLNPACVVANRLDLLVSEGKESIFGQRDLPEFFQKQCPKQI